MSRHFLSDLNRLFQYVCSCIADVLLHAGQKALIFWEEMENILLGLTEKLTSSIGPFIHPNRDGEATRIEIATTGKLKTNRLPLIVKFYIFENFFHLVWVLDVRTANYDVAAEASVCFFLSSFCSISLPIMAFTVEVDHFEDGSISLQ